MKINREKFITKHPKTVYRPEDMKGLLREMIQRDKLEDIIIAIGDVVKVKSMATIYPATHKKISESELKDFVTEYFSASAWSDLSAAREELDDDIEIERYPEDPRNREVYRFRVNGVRYRAPFGYKGVVLTMRAISDVVPSFDDLKTPMDIRQNFASLKGLVIIGGETGSGKSTLMHAGIKEMLEDHSRDLVIAEYSAPIEYVHDKTDKGFSEIYPQAVGPHKDCKTFAQGVRNAVRRNTDVVVVGELRDVETADAVLQAANIGNLVISSVHANSIWQIVRRIANLYDEDVREFKAREMMEETRLMVVQYLAKAGDGRIPVQEILVVDERTREALGRAKWKDFYVVLKECVHKYGQTMQSHAEKLFNSGEITEKTYRLILSGC